MNLYLDDMSCYLLIVYCINPICDISMRLPRHDIKTLQNRIHLNICHCHKQQLPREISRVISVQFQTHFQYTHNVLSSA